MPTHNKNKKKHPHPGRPPEDGEARNTQVQIRLKLEELDRWSGLAAKDGRSLSNWIRHTVGRSIA